MEEKIREMQNFFGLRETGHLDPNTLDVMREPRCGVSDVENFSFYPGKPKWKNHTITYMWDVLCQLRGMPCFFFVFFSFYYLSYCKKKKLKIVDCFTFRFLFVNRGHVTVAAAASLAAVVELLAPTVSSLCVCLWHWHAGLPSTPRTWRERMWKAHFVQPWRCGVMQRHWGSSK